MSVKMINWLITKNAKKRATTPLSNFACVRAPMYCESQRMILGRKKVERPETTGGATPEMM